MRAGRAGNQGASGMNDVDKKEYEWADRSKMPHVGIALEGSDIMWWMDVVAFVNMMNNVQAIMWNIHSGAPYSRIYVKIGASGHEVWVGNDDITDDGVPDE